MNMINLPNIPVGPAAKFAAYIAAIIVSAKYSLEWLKRGFVVPPLTPSTFIAVIFATLYITILLYWWQEYSKKRKP